MTTLYHVTTRSRLAAIATDGLNEGSFWSATAALRDYYVETVREEGEEPVVLATDLAMLEEAFREADRPSIDEPITRAIGHSEDEVHKGWATSGGGWAASLAIVRSIRYGKRVPVECLFLETGKDYVRLARYRG